MADDFGAFESDPTADFLAREKAILGNDASLFSSDNVNDIQVNPMPTTQIASGGNFDSDFGNFETVTSPAINNNNNQLNLMSPVQAAPMMNQMNVLQTEQNTSAKLLEAVPMAASGMSNDVNLVEKIITEEDVKNSPFVKELAEKRKVIIEEHDAKNEAKHNEILENAKKELEKFYNDYNQKKIKTSENHKLLQSNNQIENTNPNELTWETVCKNVDFKNSGKAKNEKNLERMKNLLLDLSKSKDFIKTN